MSVRSPAEHENADLRHAGMDSRHQGCQDAPETSMSIWIPALHAGMTQSRSSLKVTEAPPTRIFQGELIGRAEPAIDHESFSSLLT